jgi:predicted MFS family arabinose efflux permease
VQPGARKRNREGVENHDPPWRGLSAVGKFSAASPFRVRAFRFQWPADLLTSCAFEMETIILGWYVLAETGSVLLLTVFGALLFVGTLVAPLFGVAGDRIGHRNVLLVMRAFYVVQAATLAAVALSGHLNPMVVLGITALMGMVRPSDLGVRIALTADIIPSDRLTAAMGISRTTSDSARVAGALTGAGVFALFGIGPAYVAIACFYAMGLLLTFGVPNMRRKRDPAVHIDLPRPSAWRDLREGIAHIWSSTPMLAAVLMALLVNLTAFPFSNGLLPYVVREIYHLDQTALGYLAASFSFGALIGSIIVSLRENPQPSRTMLVAAVLWHLFLLVFAFMPNLYAGIAALSLAGLAQSFCIISLTVLLLRTSDERFRGRVVGVRMLAIYTLPLGLLASGTLIDAVGFKVTASLYIAVGLACIAAMMLRWRADL